MFCNSVWRNYSSSGSLYIDFLGPAQRHGNVGLPSKARRSRGCRQRLSATRFRNVLIRSVPLTSNGVNLQQKKIMIDQASHVRLSPAKFLASEIAGTTSRQTGAAKSSISRGRRDVSAMPFIVLGALLLAILLPTWTSFYAGPLRLTVYRCLLLVLVIPCGIRVFARGSSIKTQPSDWCVLFFVAWAACGLILNLGNDGFQTAGILVVETLGGYCVARCCIRGPEDFFRLAKWLFWIIAFLAPFTIFECIYGTDPFISRVAPIGARFGLHRAFGPFDHPILNGVFCATALGFVWFHLPTRWRNLPKRLIQVAIIVIAAMTSVSSGAVAIIGTQTLLIFWNWVTKRVPHRWIILAAIFGVAYVGIDMTSNRTPITVGLYYLTFNSETAYGRVIIWDGGTAEIAKSPLFGNGTGAWNHPTWMSESMDNFWLYNGVVYGLPAAFALMGAGAYLAWKLCQADWTRGSAIDRCRRGWLCSFAGLAVGASTVHLWNSAYILFCILLGSGMWMLETLQGMSEQRAVVRKTN